MAWPGLPAKGVTQGCWESWPRCGRLASLLQCVLGCWTDTLHSSLAVGGPPSVLGLLDLSLGHSSYNTAKDFPQSEPEEAEKTSARKSDVIFNYLFILQLVSGVAPPWFSCVLFIRKKFLGPVPTSGEGTPEDGRTGEGLREANVEGVGHTWGLAEIKPLETSYPTVTPPSSGKEYKTPILPIAGSYPKLPLCFCIF